MASKYGIYALFKRGDSPEPRNVRYIGKGRLPSRPRSHGSKSNLSRYARLPVVCWIAALRRDGLDYDWVTLEETDKNGAGDVERKWIASFKAIGAKLLNCTDGGEGMLGWSPGGTTRRLRSVNAKASWLDPGFREKMRNSRLSRWSDVEARVVQSRSMGGRPFVDETGRRYETLSEAARALGVSKGNIRAVLVGRYRHTGGHVFSYLKDCLA